MTDPLGGAMENDSLQRHYLLPGGVFAHPEPHEVTTVLGSCVAVCLWDSDRRLGGINHYLLALWNGEGLPTPRFGNIAIHKLAEKVERAGGKRPRLRAKIFGGSSILQTQSGLLNVGERNIQVAVDLLEEMNIPIVARHVGGPQGRRIIFNTHTGEVWMRILPSISAARERVGAAVGR